MPRHARRRPAPWRCSALSPVPPLRGPDHPPGDREGRAAFGSRSFGAVGTFERVVGRAYGEVDPRAPASAAIQDVGLAPTNARGMVEYATDVDIIRPADPARGNKVLLVNILSRGNKGALSCPTPTWADLAGSTRRPTPATAGCSGRATRWLWFGWQADVLPSDGRMTLSVPVARNPDGSPITGLVRSELVVRAPATTLSLAHGWFTGATHAAYPSVSTDNRPRHRTAFVPTLTVRPRRARPASRSRARRGASRVPAGQPATPDPARILLPGGVPAREALRAGLPARDPLVMGLGFAATRDLGAS